MIDKDTIAIEYKIKSALWELEAARYINEIEGSIYTEDEQGVLQEEVGKIKLNRLLIGEAVDSSFNLYQLFDWSEPILEIGELIFDFKTGEWKEEVTEHFDSVFIGSDLLIIERIEILPKYRGQKLALKIIKDAYTRFSGGCALVVLKSFPIQFESGIVKGELDEWDEKMKYNLFETDEEKARYQLLGYSQKMGFEIFMGDEILFLNPAIRYEALEKIELN